MNKKDKAKVLAKKGEVYNLSRDIGFLSAQGQALQEKINKLNKEISEMEKKEGK